MLYTTLHRPWARMLTGVFGELIVAFSLSFFIVPLGLYAGGTMGVCQLVRTLLQDVGGLDLKGYDIAGVLYFLSNIPILFYAHRVLGRQFVAKTLVCTVAYSFFYSVIPAPGEMMLDDTLTSCLLGGILTGVGTGMVLTSGSTGGGLDAVGLCLSKRGGRITVGRFSLMFNAGLYTVCFFLFSPETALYSVIYNFTANMVLDRAHQQNISVQALIFTRAEEKALAHAVMEKLGRGVTWWEGMGAYTGEGIHVLFVCLSKYEMEELFHVVHQQDPHAFIALQEGIQIYGNFQRKLD